MLGKSFCAYFHQSFQVVTPRARLAPTLAQPLRLHPPGPAVLQLKQRSEQTRHFSSCRTKPSRPRDRLNNAHFQNIKRCDLLSKKCKSKNVKIHHPKIAYGKSKMWRWFSSFWGLSYPKQNGKLESFRSHFARENDDFIGGFDGKYEHGGIEPMKNKDQTGLQWAMGIEFGTWMIYSKKK